MICTIDAGNSNIVCVIYNEKKEVHVKKRFETITDLKDAYTAYTRIFETLKEGVDRVVLSCVVPKIHDLLMDVLETVFMCKPYSVSQTSVPTFINRLDNPLEIGADFIATAVGAMERFTTPLIIVDVGSATKITAVDYQGAFRGGIIIPGLGISMNSMVEKIVHLPNVTFDFPSTVIGHDTVSAIQSGIMYAAYYQITGLVDAVSKELGESCTVVLTGGYSSLFKEKLSSFEWVDNLANEGLYVMAMKGMIRHD